MLHLTTLLSFFTFVVSQRSGVWLLRRAEGLLPAYTDRSMHNRCSPLLKVHSLFAATFILPTKSLPSVVSLFYDDLLSSSISAPHI